MLMDNPGHGARAHLPVVTVFGQPQACRLVDLDAQAGRLGDVRVPGLDGERRFYAFTPLSGTPAGAGEALYLAVGIPRSVVLREANWQLARDLALLGLGVGPGDEIIISDTGRFGDADRVLVR